MTTLNSDTLFRDFTYRAVFPCAQFNRLFPVVLEFVLLPWEARGTFRERVGHKLEA